MDERRSGNDRRRDDTITGKMIIMGLAAISMVFLGVIISSMESSLRRQRIQIEELSESSVACTIRFDSMKKLEE